MWKNSLKKNYIVAIIAGALLLFTLYFAFNSYEDLRKDYIAPIIVGILIFVFTFIINSHSENKKKQ